MRAYKQTDIKCPDCGELSWCRRKNNVKKRYYCDNDNCDVIHFIMDRKQRIIIQVIRDCTPSGGSS